MLGSDEGIKLGSTHVEVVGTLLVNVYGITLGIDVGKELVSLNVSFDGSNGDKLEGLFFVY